MMVAHTRRTRFTGLGLTTTAALLLAGCSESRPLIAPDVENDPLPQPRASSHTATGATFTVTNTNDAGLGSLRQAIDDANATPNVDASTPDLIDFDIDAPTDPGCDAGSGLCTIQPLSALPQIIEAVVIDGYTQTGASPNTNDTSLGLNTVLKIELDGSQVGAVIGLDILSPTPSTIKGLVVNNFAPYPSGVGIRTQGLVLPTIEGNFIGTDVTGTIDLGNGSGVSGGTVLGGSNPAARNLISGNHVGIITAVTGQVAGNLIGTDVTGTLSLGNGTGFLFGRDKLVGGTSAPERNVISGNGGSGISTGDRDVIQGNYIGLDVTGTQPLANGDGIRVHGEAPTIGGDVPGAGNVISGNLAQGIFVLTDDAVVQGNLIGTDHTGTVAVPNQGNGIQIQHTESGAQIGGVSPLARNVISGHSVSYGILLGGTDHKIQGNYIGTDASGTVAIPNTLGVLVSVGSSNTIGGIGAGAGNVISGNDQGGLDVAGSGGNVIQANLIGTAAGGVSPLGNGSSGIHLRSPDNLVGGTSAQAANVIAYNGRGITLDAVSQNSILGNSIHSNAGAPITELGIDLYPWGVTPNDPGDGDAGNNDLQNFPVITAASAGGGTVLVVGTLDSEPSELYRLEFFANTAADPSGHGEGETFIGYADVPTDASGLASFSESFPAPPGVTPGHYMTATATDAAGNTSEFSDTLRITDDITGPATTNTTASPNPVAVGDPVTLTADVDDSSTGGADVVSAEYSLDGGATWAPMSATDGAFDSPTEGVTVGFNAPGTAEIYDVCVRGTDAASNTGAAECIMLVVYDPVGGFVTGSGWIDSPPGAYVDDPMLTGKATFGFVSKYKKGANQPTGNTAFRFQAASLRFASTSYDWLVVNQGGTNAQFKGSGEINNGLAPNGTEFRFMIWAKDGSPDTLRIKIWWEDLGVETVVYDNGFNQPIGAGQISVHAN